MLTKNLANIDELDAHLISIFVGLVSRFEYLDNAKKYPISIATIRNTRETFINGYNQLFLVASTFLA